MKRFHWGKLVLLFIFIAPLAILVMFLWNNALAPVLHVSEVTFWQALGILVLSKILFSSFSGGRSRRYPTWKDRISQKWDTMTPDEKERWKDHWWQMRYKPWDSSSDTKQPGAGS
jgi:hypothetical protein